MSDETTVTTGLGWRVLSALPFLFVSVFGIIAALAWLFVLVLGFGSERGAVWSWASGRSAGEAVPQVGLLFGIGIICLLIVVVAGYATTIAFSTSAPLHFWTAAESLALLLLLGLIVAQVRFAETLTRSGIEARDFWFLIVFCAVWAIVMRLRRRHLKRQTAIVREATHG